MKFAFILVLVAFGGGISSLCAQLSQSAENETATIPQGTYGRVEHGYYVSPTGLYRIKIPVLAGLGGVISDTPNVVTFDDDYSIHTSIAAFPLSTELKSDLATHGAKDFLASFFASIIMPDFKKAFKGASMEPKAIFMPSTMDGALLVFSLLPGGSNFEQRSSIFPQPENKKVVAKRGNLCFIKYDHVFVISTELAERALERWDYHRTPAEEDAILRKRLLNLASQMEFTPQTADARN